MDFQKTIDNIGNVVIANTNKVDYEQEFQDLEYYPNITISKKEYYELVSSVDSLRSQLENLKHRIEELRYNIISEQEIEGIRYQLENGFPLNLPDDILDILPDDIVFMYQESLRYE
jgi:predicted mannosyl-3-phosphoglycerate phosphatase (HAD superfamily)